MLLIIACDNGSEIDPEDDGELLPTTFPNNFTPPNDYLTGNPLLGWGGGEGTITHTPIVFVHGNAHAADNWITMATYFAEEGYTWNELWAVSYLQAVNDEHYNSNAGNWAEIDEFVQSVLDFTGEDKVNVISHSLGVTVARTWLRHTEDYPQVETFIGIAGANHGVAYCNAGLLSGLCEELGHPDSDFLQWLNDVDETPSEEEVQWVTIYNGGNLDIFYPAQAIMNNGDTLDLHHSPILNGATNIELPQMDHFQLIVSPTVFDTVNHYLNASL